MNLADHFSRVPNTTYGVEFDGKAFQLEIVELKEEYRQRGPRGKRRYQITINNQFRDYVTWCFKELGKYNAGLLTFGEARKALNEETNRMEQMIIARNRRSEFEQKAESEESPGERMLLRQRLAHCEATYSIAVDYFSYEWGIEKIA